FNTKRISQAWLKMYEVLTNFDLISKDGKTFKSFHLCEAPGNFISAINHYIKTNTTIKDFDWTAQTLNPWIERGKNKREIIGDDYGYIRKYPKKWTFGKENKGDIMMKD